MANSIAPGSYYSPRPFPTHAIDQCDASPNALNSYPPPHGSQQSLVRSPDPLQPQGDSRYVYSGPDPRDPYNHRQLNPLAGYPRAGPHPPPGMGYNGEVVGRRTSVACTFCRKRKVRCCDVLQSPSGPTCKNCRYHKQECIFKPLNSHMAFILISAAPGDLLPLQAAMVEVDNRQRSPVEYSNSIFLPGNDIDGQMLGRLSRREMLLRSSRREA